MTVEGCAAALRLKVEGEVPGALHQSAGVRPHGEVEYRNVSDTDSGAGGTSVCRPRPHRDAATTRIGMRGCGGYAPGWLGWMGKS